MKKLLFILLVAMSFTASAQYTSPRFGTVPGEDNTGRTLTYGFRKINDAAGADSTTIFTNVYSSVLQVAMVDSFTFKSPNVKQSYATDRLTIVATGASGNKVKFTGSNWIAAGTATLSTGGRAVINFIFDGAKWVEAGRVVQ